MTNDQNTFDKGKRMNNIWNVDELESIGKKRAIRYGLQGVSVEEATAEFVSEVWFAMQRVDKENGGATAYLWRRGIGAIKDYIKFGVKSSNRFVSGDAPSDEGLSKWDTVGTKGDILSEVAKREERRILASVMAVLTEEERELIEAIYIEEKQLVEIAAEQGVSKQAIDKKRNRAVERMRKAAA